MCDTLCVLPSWSKNGITLFAKNSDRSPNEPHLAMHIPALEHEKNSFIRLTYITIPQAEHTLEALLFKPSWTWGAEMGVNAASVAIGNEAVFTRGPRGPESLLGMDLVRLALERAASAADAVDCITGLLEEYGQGGNCGFDHKFYYDNSFLIADPNTCYVLETAGKRWAAKQFTDRVAISNRLSIHCDHSLRGGIKEGYDFAGKLTEPLFTFFAASKLRQDESCSYLNQPADTARMMAALRQHHPEDEGTVFTKGSVRSVCMHAGGTVGDHTTGSFVLSLRSGLPATVWCTAASTPCISAFKPVFLGIPSEPPVFEDEPAAKAYWLKRETIHRGVLAGQVDAQALRSKIHALEVSWLSEEEKLFSSGAADTEALLLFAQKAAQQEEEIINTFLPPSAPAMPARGRFSKYWTKKNEALGK